MFSGEQFRRISTIVLDANPDAAGLGVLREQLVDLLINVGAADDGTEFGGWFRQEANKRINHKALARQFARIARSHAPLDHPLWTGELRKELIAVARRKWPERLPTEPLRNAEFVPGASINFLSKCTPQELQDIARERAKYHTSFVQRKQPKKNRLDTLIEQLADIYANITHYPCHHSCLPHSANSYFAQFCRTILKPFFTTREVSLGAISKRWKRLKDDASRRPSGKKKSQERCNKDCNKRKRRTL
jgi:hypothetical protein